MCRCDVLRLGHSGVAAAGRFQGEELPFDSQAGSEAAGGAMGGKDAVAWLDDGDGIAVAGLADGAGRGGFADCCGQLAVAAGFAVGDCAHDRPHGQLEGRACRLDGQGEDAAGAGEVLVELRTRLA